MYIDNEDEFNRTWLMYADNWIDYSKVTPYNQYMFIYSGPRTLGFMWGLKHGIYDKLMNPEALAFFKDNIDNPLMKKRYQFALSLEEDPHFKEIQNEIDGKISELKSDHKISPEMKELIEKGKKIIEECGIPNK